MPGSSRPFHEAIAAELDLQPDDELLDVGCGSGRLLAEHAAHVRCVAGWGGTDESGARDAFGIWSWSDADAQRLVEEAGFADVTISVLPVMSRSRLVHATKPMAAEAVDAREATELQAAVAT